jgi:hypothetical protein
MLHIQDNRYAGASNYQLVTTSMNDCIFSHLPKYPLEDELLDLIGDLDELICEIDHAVARLIRERKRTSFTQ